MESLSDLLVPGERIVESLRFSLWTIAKQALRDLLIFAAAGGLLWFDQTRLGGAAVALAGTIDLLWGVARYCNNRIWITDRRLIAQTGWPGRDVLDFPYDRFESAKVEQSLLGRLFGFGDVEISGVGSTHARLSCIASPIGFKRALENAKGLGAAAKAAPAPPPKQH